MFSRSRESSTRGTTTEKKTRYNIIYFLSVLLSKACLSPAAVSFLANRTERSVKMSDALLSRRRVRHSRTPATKNETRPCHDGNSARSNLPAHTNRYTTIYWRSTMANNPRVTQLNRSKNAVTVISGSS